MKLQIIAGAVTAALISSASFAGSVTTDGDDLKIKTKGGLEVSSGDFSLQIGGRIQWDYNHAELNGVTDEDNLDIRRARLFFKGDVAKDWSYKAQFNIGENNGGTPEDLYISYGGWGKAAKLTVGRHKVGLGLEELTSSKDITALERSGITEGYVVGRADGVSLSGKVGGVFYSLNAFEDPDAVADSDFGFASRVAFVPFEQGDTLIHVGLAYADRADDRTTTGIELAANMGSFSIQSEFFDDEQAGVDRDGYYLQAGWIMTGETRPYKNGTFKRVKPNSDSGAWELFARIEEGEGDHGDIELGSVDASAYTIGVNWYANSNVRFGANYSEGESNAPGSSDEGEEFRLRLQLTF
ncbi:MAG: ATPase [Gammaproteobacteria bacterium]|nr:ATPase [Gammaproteobacteria bacterium]